MFDAPVRRMLPRVLAGVVAPLVRAGVSPNLLSGLGALLAVAAAGAIVGGQALVGLLLWLASRLLDALDGLVARASSQNSLFGGYLDITLDMLAYGAMVLAFACVHADHTFLMLCVMFGYLLVTTTTLALSSMLEREAREHPGNDRSLQFTPGYAEAGETTVVYVAWTLFPEYIGVIGWVWVAICLATVMQRSLLARRLLVSSTS